MAMTNTPEMDRTSMLLMELRSKYGAWDKIPQGQLAELGYVLVQQEGVARVIKQSALQDIEKEKVSLETKYEQKPFSVIELKIMAREVLNRQNPDLLDRVKYLLARGKDMDSIYPPDHPVHIFEEEYARFLRERHIVDGMSARHYQSMPANLQLWLSESELGGGAMNKLIREMDLGPEGYPTTPQEAEKFLVSAERARGKMSDVQLLKQDFLEYYREAMDTFIGDTAFDEAEMLQYCKNKGIVNVENLHTHVLVEFLKAEGLVQDSPPLKNIKGFEQLAEFLRSDRSLGAETIRDINELKSQIRSADLETKKALSGRLKALEQKRKHNAKLIDGLLAATEPYKAVARYYNKVIDAVEQATVVQNKSGTIEAVYLDANYDERLDADPGQISGDCTAGKPLPFSKPFYPIYNVKVFNAEKRHIGNIYLLVTVSETKKHRVWHLDAIQIPAAYDWDDFIPKMIARLGEAAKHGGAHFITANSNPEGISNYNYISEAVAKSVKARYSELADEYAGDYISIDVPQKGIDDEIYSLPQSTGKALVLWSDKEIPASESGYEVVEK